MTKVTNSKKRSVSAYSRHLENRTKGNYRCVACRRNKHYDCTRINYPITSICTCDHKGVK